MKEPMVEMRCKVCDRLLFYAESCVLQIKCQRCGHVHVIQYKPKREKAVLPEYETREIGDIIRSHST